MVPTALFGAGSLTKQWCASVGETVPGPPCLGTLLPRLLDQYPPSWSPSKSYQASAYSECGSSAPPPSRLESGSSQYQKLKSTFNKILLIMTDRDARDSDDEDAGLGMFEEPEGYRQPEKPPSTITHTTLSRQNLSLRLIGQSPLWVGLVQTVLLLPDFLRGARLGHHR